jgi:4-hydroxy-L-threonine phosphate dehydrogenase PdxA
VRLPREALTPGTPLAAGGRATVDYVAAAIRFVNDGHAAAIVACPHSETSVNAAGIPFSGYPSLLARLMNSRLDVFSEPIQSLRTRGSEMHDIGSLAGFVAKALTKEVGNIRLVVHDQDTHAHDASSAIVAR